MSKFDSQKQSNPSTSTSLILDDRKIRINHKPYSIIRKFYHNIRWIVFTLVTAGKAGAIYKIDPNDIVHGQLPSGQFPRRARRFIRAGDWDTEVIAIENHSVYKSIVDHFVHGRPWQKTLRYNEALEEINTRGHFRGVTSHEEVLSLFRIWDGLYDEISQNGLMSMRKLYKQGIIDNPCKRLDEISINLSRDGSPILNDGWHRFCIARVLKIPLIPVRILARHRLYNQWEPHVPGQCDKKSSL